MDRRGNQEKRRTAKVPSRKGGGKDSRSKAKKSGTLKKPDHKKKSSVSRDSKENAQEKIKKLFEPIKDQLYLVIEYINILELRRDLVKGQEITIFLEFFTNVRKQCEFYLNCQLLKGNRNG